MAKEATTKVTRSTPAVAAPARPKTKREIEAEEVEDEEEDDDEDYEEDDDDEDEDDDDDTEMELDLDLDQEVGSKTAFDTIPAGTYPAIVMSETSQGDLPVIRKVARGKFEGQVSVNFGFKLVGPAKHVGRVFFNEIPLALKTNKGVSVLALRLAGILGPRPLKINTREGLEEVLEETRGMPCYIRISRQRGEGTENKNTYYNNVFATYPSDDKHPINTLEEVDD